MSDKWLHFPEVDSPAVEKVRSIGADDAGITKVSIAIAWVTLFEIHLDRLVVVLKYRVTSSSGGS